MFGRFQRHLAESKVGLIGLELLVLILGILILNVLLPEF